MLVGTGVETVRLPLPGASSFFLHWGGEGGVTTSWCFFFLLALGEGWWGYLFLVLLLSFGTGVEMVGIPLLGASSLFRHLGEDGGDTTRWCFFVPFGTGVMHLLLHLCMLHMF